MCRAPLTELMSFDGGLSVGELEASVRNRLAGRKELTLDHAFRLLVRFNKARMTPAVRCALIGLLAAYGYAPDEDGVFRRKADWPEDRTADDFGQMDLTRD